VGSTTSPIQMPGECLEKWQSTVLESRWTAHSMLP
jgi:hypothetical protein